MHKLVTPSGWEFNAASYVKINGEWVDTDDLNDAQKSYVATRLNIQAMNAAYAGQREYYAENLPDVHEVFPQLAKA